MAGIASVCTKNRLVRSNYYSDYYRAEFNMGGEKRLWEVQHMSIPFDRAKEIAFQKRFGYSDSEMADFYDSFRQNVKHGFNMTEKLRSIDDEAISKSSFFFTRSHVTKKDGISGGYDIYVISEPTEPLVGSQIITSQGAYLRMILTLGIRLLQTAKVYSDRGFYAGVFDLDSFDVISNEDKIVVKDPFFMFSSDGEEGPAALTKDACTFLPRSVAIGQAPVSASSDIYCICAMLWSMLDGRHYTEAPDLSREPKYIPHELAELLRRGMTEGASARKDLSSGLRQAYKTLDDGYVPFEEPAYLAEMQAAVNEYSKYAEPEEDAEEEDYDDDDSDDEEEPDEDNEIFLDRMSGKQKVGLGIAAGLLSAVIVAGSFAGGKILGEQGWRTQTAVAAPVETEEPEPVEATPQPDIPEATPIPAPSSKAVSDSEMPFLDLDPDYKWYRSDYEADEFCAILFTDTYDIEDEIIESWNFKLNSTDVMCYVYRRPELVTDVICNSNGGDKVLVIAGNGAGKMRVKMTQTELAQYFQYKFTYGNLNGLSCLKSTGSTPFVPPVPTPEATPAPGGVLEENPEPDEIDVTDDGTAPAVLPADQVYEQYDGGYDSGGYYGGGSYGGGQYYSEPQQQIVETYTAVTNTVTQTYDFADSGMGTRSFSITASNNYVRVGQSITVSVYGDVDPVLNTYTSDSTVATISSYPDANGYYVVTGNHPGTVLVNVESPSVGTAFVQIDVVN